MSDRKKQQRLFSAACPMPETLAGGRGAYPGAVDAFNTTSSSKTSVSFVSSSLTTGISLLSLSDKSAVDVAGDLDVDDWFC